MKNIFVSSTFSDFQQERDILREDVMSRLNQFSLPFGESVNFSDLRWGIDTSEVKEEDISDVILSSCLDEIDRTRPYMIILLGDRYGFIPGKDAIQRETNRKQFALEDFEISVTHLEIEYGAFLKGNVKHIYVYLRNSENDYSNDDRLMPAQEALLCNKLVALKEKLKKIFGNHVHTYDSCDVQTGKFADMVYSDLLNDFNQEWTQIEEMSIYQKEVIVEQRAVEERAAFFLAFTQYAKELQSKLRASEYGRIALIGEVGTGKSTLFSFLVATLKNKGWDTIPFLSGNTILSTDEKSIALTIIWQLEKILDLKNENIYDEKRSTIEIKDYLNRLFELYDETGRNLFIGVDAIEQIVFGGKKTTLWFLPEKRYKNIYTLVTTWKNELIDKAEYSLCHMPILTLEEQVNVINGILRRNGKQLPQVLINEIVNVPAARNPLMLYLIVNRLSLMNSSDYNVIYNKGGGIVEIIRQQLRIIRELPQNAKEMSKHILSFMAEILNIPQVLDAMYLIATSRYGLRYDDIHDILLKNNKELLPVHFSRFINLIFDMFLIRDDGRIDFIHQSFRLSMQQNLVREHDGMIAQHLLRLSRRDIVRNEEVTYHLIRAGMEDALVQEISEASLEEKRYAANDIYYMSRITPDYILRVLNDQIQRNGLSHELIDFVNFYNSIVVRSSKDSIESIEIVLETLDHLQVRLEDVMIQSKTNALYQRIRYTYIWVCLSIGQLYVEMHRDEAYSKALPYYQTVISHAKELYDLDPSGFATMELGTAYYETASILKRLGGEKNSRIAIEYNKLAYEMALESFEKQKYTASYFDLLNYILFARAHANNCIAKHDDQKNFYAIELLQNTILAVGSVVDENNMSEELLIEYAKLYLSLGNAYSNIAINQLNEIAIDNYKKYLVIARRHFLESGDEDSIYSISTAYINLVQAYRRLGDKESLQLACSYAEDAVRYSKQLYAKYKKFDSLWIYGNVLSEYAKVLSEIGEHNLLVKGQEAIYDAIELISIDSCYFADREMIFFWDDIIHGMTYIAGKSREREIILKTIDLAKSVKNRVNARFLEKNYDTELAYTLASICDYGAMMCQFLGEKEIAGIGVDFAKESLNITKKIIEAEGDSVFLQRSLEVSLFKVGVALRENGSDTTEILPYLEQGLEIAEKLAELSDTYEKQYDYGFALIRNAEVLCLSSDTDSLSKAKEYAARAIDVRNKIADKGDTIQQHMDLAKAYQLLFSICLKLDDIKTAKESIDQAEHILKDLLKKYNSPQIQSELASAEIGLAEYLLQTGKYLDAVKYYELASYHYSLATHELGTFRIYQEYISALLRTGDAHAKSGNLDETLKYIRLSISESKRYLGFEKQIEYRVLMVDIYMAAEPILNNLIASGVEPSKVYSIMIDMYEESICTYYEALNSFKERKYISNLSALYIGLARILVKAKRKDEAIEYYNLCISVTEAHPKKGESTFVMITNEYRSYAEKGLIYIDKNEYYDALSMLDKSVELSIDAIAYFKNNEEVIDVCDDLQEYAVIAAKVSWKIGEYERAEFFLNAALITIERLETLGLSDKYHDTYTEIKNMLSILEMKSKPWMKRASEQIDSRLKKMYDDAEGYVMFDTAKAKKMFLEFLEAEASVPDDEKSDQTLIYSYNAWSQIAAIEINSNKNQQMAMGVEYMLKAVQRELEVLDMPATQNMRLEIVSDLSQDAMNGFKVCSKLGNQEQAVLFMKAITIAKYLSR